MSVRHVGDTSRVKFTITNKLTDELYDPTNLRVWFEGGGVTFYVYGVDSQIVRESTGVYYVDWTWMAPGINKAGYQITGTPGSVDSSQFDVLPSPVPSVQ